MQRAAIFAGSDIAISLRSLCEGAVFRQRDDAAELRVKPLEASKIHAREVGGGDAARAQQLRPLAHGIEGERFECSGIVRRGIENDARQRAELRGSACRVDDCAAGDWG